MELTNLEYEQLLNMNNEKIYLELAEIKTDLARLEDVVKNITEHL